MHIIYLTFQRFITKMNLKSNNRQLSWVRFLIRNHILNLIRDDGFVNSKSTFFNILERIDTINEYYIFRF